MIKKIYEFIVILVWVFASIGCAGWLFFDGHIVQGIAVLLLGAMAFPYMRSCFKDLIS